MGWFFRVIELEDGRWSCRRGATEIDGHASLHDAIQHVTALASHEVSADVFLHHLDGTVQRFHAAGGRRSTAPPRIST